MRHVILLSGRDDGAAHTALLETLHGAGIVTTTVTTRAVATEGALGDELSTGLLGSDPPLAVLYEVSAGADIAELHSAASLASSVWPEAPLVACRCDRSLDGRNRRGGAAARTLNSSTLKRLGFRAVADVTAQLPVLLRELEERGTTGELRFPEDEAEEAASASLLLPEKLSPEHLRAAFEAVASMHFASDPKSAASIMMAGLASIIEADRWTVYLTSEEINQREGTTLEPLAARGLTTSERELPKGDWRSALRGDALALSGAESEAARAAVADAELVNQREGGRAVLAAPLANSERVMGVIEAVREDEQQARPFSAADASLLSALAVPLTAALANSARVAEAERLSQTDDLTKLHNARFLRQYLIAEVKRSRRYGSSVTVLFLDLDDFKRINDHYGHLIGSHVLMEMAAVILASVRDTDVVARYGGDEFVVILPETDLEHAAGVAERVRERIAGHKFTGGRNHRLSLTASFGVATFPQHAQSPQQLIACADSAMYQAKAALKNCICFAPDSA